MTRRYAYALIFFAIAILGSLVWLHYQLVEEALAESYAFERETVGEAIDISFETTQDLIHETERMLQDESKAKFRPIIVFISEAMNGVNELVDKYQAMGYDRWGTPLPESEQKMLILELAKTLSLELEKMDRNYCGLLDEYGQEMDLLKDEIKNKKKGIQSAILKIQALYSEGLLSGNKLHRRDMLVLRYVNVVGQVIKDVTSIAGGYTISCWFGPKQYPFIGKAFENPRIGKPIDTYIGIGTYDDELDVRYLKVVVDGDTLRADSRSGLRYSFTPDKKGDQVLKMEMLSENPLTGYTTSRTHYYEYYVR